MFDVSKIRTALNGLVGWENPIDPDYSIVDATNQASTSGRRFTDNKFVKVPFIKDNTDYVSISNIQFNSVLTDIQNEAISNVCDRVFDQADFIDRQILYKNANNKIATETLPSGFVGYKICPSYDNNYTFEIVRDILEFSGTGDITLMLFNSAKQEAVFTQNVTIASSLQEVELNWKLDDTLGFYKGHYYYGYMTTGLTVAPFKRDYNNASSMSCITGLDIEPIQSPIVGTDLFDLDDVENASECWGLNPDFLVYNDYTDFIIQNKRLFAYAVQLQGQIQAINIYLASLRSNEKERKSEAMIRKLMLELDGANTESWNRKGLRGILTNEITRLKEEVVRLQSMYTDRNQIVMVTKS